MSVEKNKISVCALMLYPFDTVPGQRFRIEQWEPYLEKDNISIDYYSFADEDLVQLMAQNGKFPAKTVKLIKAFAKRASHLTSLSKYDAIFLYRAASMVGPAVLERIMKLSKLPIIFDFDDAIFMSHTANANKLFSWAKFAGKTDTLCKLSTSVTVGNNWLAECGRKFNQRTFVVPTSIDTDIYSPLEKADREPRDKVIVGWTGSSTSQYHLELFESTLAKLLERRDVEIRVISNREPSFKQIPYTWRDWSPQTEVENIGQLDIGIMPNPDDEWSKGKCALKALQYMSMAVPTVCSNVGANKEVIKNGENGFLASNEDEWLNILEKLIDDESSRIKFGEAARKTVLENYSMTRCADLFGKVIRDSIDFVNKEGQKN